VWFIMHDEKTALVIIGAFVGAVLLGFFAALGRY